MTADYLRGGGEMGARMRALDWATTPLGDPSTWPQSLRTTVSTCLHSRFPILVWWGSELVMLYNDAYAQILGAKHPAALGRPGPKVWPEIWPIIGPLLRDVVEHGAATWNEQQRLLVFRRGFVEESYFTFSYSPIYDESGGVGGVFTAVTEVTAQVLSQRRIEALHDLARRTTGATTVAAVCREAIAALAADPADVPFALLYECRDDQLVLAGAHGVDEPALAPASCPLDAAPWRMQEVARTPGAVLELGQPRRAVVRSLAASGVTIGVLVAGTSPQLALDDAYRGFYELIANQLGSAITSARSHEHERARLEALAEFDRAKTAFFGNVSHEFRTPLALILGPVEEAAASPTHTLGGADLQAVLRNAQRLQKLVNQLLDFARIEAKRAHAQLRPTDLAALTADLASAFRSAIERGGVALEVDCAPLAEPVLVDPEMWEKIVLNLLSNAFKYTFEGRIEVALRDRGDTVELRIADTGVGIAADQLPRIFERFHRIEGARARSYEGSGIGLALVHDLVAMHGGHIAAASTPGHGTTFTITLPRTRAERTLAPVASAGQHTRAFVDEALLWVSAAEPEAPTPTPARSSARVLLADDNADMRAYITRLLGAHWQVTAVADGAQALAAARAQRPDLVLADVMMPNLDGFGLVRELRGDPKLATIPIILLSARAGEEAIAEGLRSGADDYIVKPFTAGQLLVRVEAQLATSRLREAAHEERRRVFAALMNAPAAFSVFAGDDLVIELANHACLAAWGRDESVIGKPLLEALPEVHDQPFAELLRRVRHTHHGIHQERFPTRLVRDGVLEERYYDFVYEPVPGVDAVFVMAVDVTASVSAERAVEQALADANRANRAKDEFLALLGHELRNPLAPILTALEMMELKGDRDVTRERQVLTRQARHLIRLVDDLLDVSRIARGRVELEPTRVSVAELVTKSIETASPLFEERGHHLAVEVPDDLVVDADVDRMVQVLSNLLTNAAKYTPPRGDVRVRARRDGDDVVITVRDSGIGITPEILPHVFDMFIQERQALDRSRGGLGLGLAIVRALVEQHGGRVAARSDGQGHGSELEVRLPAAKPVPVATGTAVHGTAALGRAVGGRRVLIVDDNADAAELLAEAVGALGYETQVAHDGPMALKLVEQFAPDVALVDIGLPVMDGYELADRLRNDGGRTMNLIAVTGYGQASDRERSRRSGFDAHIVKPVDLTTLASVLEDLAIDSGS